MTLRFGTDGVRGVANEELTPELVLALGRAAARVLVEPGGFGFYVGRDTRQSGDMLLAALSAGINSEGRDVADLGVVPTPAVAWASADRHDPGAMISASHNPYADNGIKFFARGGKKLSDDTEERLEAELDRILSGNASRNRAAVVGTTRRERFDETYEHDLLRALEGRSLRGFHVVLDCANGAASRIAPDVFTRAGAQLHVIHNTPNGRNINDGCGSTFPQDLQDAVVANRANLGLAFDGDADRVLAVDETGKLVDGDHLLALFAIDLKARGRLAHDTVVVTVMSNLGLKLGMEAAGIDVVETKVGDRYVLEAMEANDYTLGGEQSGHIIFGELATTGDGLLAGLAVLDLVSRNDRPLSELAAGAMTSLPQTLRNVRVADRDGLAGAGAVWDEVATVEKELGHNGRVLLRASGTEPVVRVMVEAADKPTADAAVDRLAAVVARVLGAPTT